MGTPRIFTVPEAEATLPLVRRIVGDLLATSPRWREAVAGLEVLTGAAPHRELAAQLMQEHPAT